MDTEKPAKQVNALSRGIAILRYLDAQGEPVGVVQIARDLQINASTCFNLLRTLVHERLAMFDPATKKYSPGLGVLALAHAALKQDGPIRLLHPQIEQIVRLHPDLVLISSTQRITERLHQLGIESFALDTQTYADIGHVVSAIGVLLQVPGRAAALNRLVRLQPMRLSITIDRPVLDIGRVDQLAVIGILRHKSRDRRRGGDQGSRDDEWPEIGHDVSLL